MAESVSLTKTIYTALREDILNGKYTTGDALTEEEVAKAFGASRSPVRGAFRLLEESGLLRLIPNKGALVEGITRKDVADVYEIRLRIEGLASMEAAKKATPENIDQLTEIVDLSDFYLEHGNMDKLKAMDGRFHEYIFDMADRKILHNVLSQLLMDVSRFRSASIQSAGRLGQAIEEHRNILLAIAAHDPQKADLLTRTHIQNAYNNIQKLLSDSKLED